MYTNNDVQIFLQEARKNKEKVLAELPKYAKGRDANVISRAIQNNDFVAEDFDRYDSDVCERFILLLEAVVIAH